MPTPQRLPLVNNDDGVWGDIIRQYLMKEHYNDDTDNAANGGHQKITVRGGTTAAGTAPIKIAPGSKMTTAEEGAIEYDGHSMFITLNNSSDMIRRAVVHVQEGTNTGYGTIFIHDPLAGGTGSEGFLVPLAPGTDGQALRISSGVPAWVSDSGFATTTKTTSYTVGTTDTVIFANATSGNITITLPAASGLAGYRFYIKRIDGSGNTVTVARSGSDTIDGMSSFTLDLQYTAFGVVSNGSAWYIL